MYDAPNGVTNGDELVGARDVVETEVLGVLCALVDGRVRRGRAVDAAKEVGPECGQELERGERRAIVSLRPYRFDLVVEHAEQVVDELVARRNRVVARERTQRDRLRRQHERVVG